MDGIEAKLSLLEKAYDNTIVHAITLADMEKLTLPDGSVINASRGDKIELPRWMARALEEERMVSIIWNEFTVEDVLRIHYREMQRTSILDIEALPENFYWILREYVSRLEKQIRETPDPRLIEERKRLQDYVNEILDKRLQTIISAVTNDKLSNSISPKLSPEEQVLMEELRRIIKEWRRKLIEGKSTKTSIAKT